MKPLHNVCFDILKNADKYSLTQILDWAFNNILFALLSTTSDDISKKESKGFLNQVMLSLPNFLFGIISGTIEKQPFLEKINSKYIYTLVLDLDETLIHFFYTPSGGVFFVRPHCIEFLKELSNYYEIVIFTAAMKDVST